MEPVQPRTGPPAAQEVFGLRIWPGPPRGEALILALTVAGCGDGTFPGHLAKTHSLSLLSAQLITLGSSQQWAWLAGGWGAQKTCSPTAPSSVLELGKHPHHAIRQRPTGPVSPAPSSRKVTVCRNQRPKGRGKTDQDS